MEWKALMGSTQCDRCALGSGRSSLAPVPDGRTIAEPIAPFIPARFGRFIGQSGRGSQAVAHGYRGGSRLADHDLFQGP